MSNATIIPIRREYQVHRFDPIKHGVLSRHIALPWEDREAFEEILRGLLVEHQPQGPTAYHLVEDLAGAIWRKCRLLQAEGAAIRERLYEVTQTYGHEKIGHSALAHKAEKINLPVAEIVAGRLPTRDELIREIATAEQALAALDGNRRDGYRKTLGMLHEETRDAWEAEAVDAAEPEAGGYERDVDGLREFLEERCQSLRQLLDDSANAPLVVEQAHGRAIDLHDLERIARIEAHLDTKMQRLLTLLQLSRKTQPAATSAS
jgi:hypothetical protein